MSEPRYACGRCGTWICSACGGQRANTDIRYVDYPCKRCRGLAGTLVPTMHTAKMWRTHNDGPLPEPYPYGERPPAGQWAPGFGGRTVPQPKYRGMPVPSGPLDVESFRRGVNAALDAATPLLLAFVDTRPCDFDELGACTVHDYPPPACPDGLAQKLLREAGR